MTSKEISIKKEWKSGCGVSELDLHPVKVEILDNQYEFESTSYIGNTLDDESLAFNYKQEIDIRVNPGFFYIKDREFYCYNEKITQFSKVEYEEDIPFIKLKELPNGAGTIPYVNFLNGEYSYRHSEIFGTPPIIVKKYNNNELSDLNCIFDYPISSRDGVNREMGFRYTLSESEEQIILSGDIEDYPDFFSPLSRFSKCPEYWRDGHILQYNEYTYDYKNNRIILKEYDENAEYSIEFENLNIPFRCGVELNSLKNIPSDYVLVIDPTEIEDTETDSIEVFVSNTIVEHDPININIRILNSEGNGIPNKDNIFITLQSNIIKKNGSFIQAIERTPYFFSTKGIVYDYIKPLDGDIIEYNGINRAIINNRLVDGKYLIPTCGCIIPGEQYIGDYKDYNINNFPYKSYMNSTTDTAGGINIKYIPPAIIFEDHYITINILCEDKYHNIILRLNGDDDICAKQSKSVFDERISYQSGEYIGDPPYYVTSVPKDVPFPNDINFYEVSSFLSSLKKNNSQVRDIIRDLYIEDDELKITTLKIGNTKDLSRTTSILRYDTTDQTCITDGRSIYVS